MTSRHFLKGRKKCLNVANNWSTLIHSLVGYVVISNFLLLETLLGKTLNNLLIQWLILLNYLMKQKHKNKTQLEEHPGTWMPGIWHLCNTFPSNWVSKTKFLRINFVLHRNKDYFILHYIQTLHLTNLCASSPTVTGFLGMMFHCYHLVS